MVKKKPSKTLKPAKKSVAKDKKAKPAAKHKAKVIVKKHNGHASKDSKKIAEKKASGKQKPSKPVKKNNSSKVTLSKLGKAKIRPKASAIPPRKIEKIVDISQLEK